MSIELPSFDGPYCYAIVACGQVTTKSKKVADIISSKKSYKSNYHINGKELWVLALFGGGEEGRGGDHFHLEATSRKPREVNKSKSKHVDIKEFLEIIKPMIGRQIQVRITGFLSVERDRVPNDSVILPNFFEFSVEGGSVKTTRMEFEFEGAFLSNLSWSLADKGKRLAVKMSGIVNGKIDKKYLTSFIDYVDTSFRAIVLGEVPNV